MDVIPDAPLDRISNYLSAIAASQSIVSANVANSQTPGYTARQDNFANYLKEDNPFETRLSAAMGSRINPMVSGTGMPVDLQKELVTMQKNMLFYSIATRRASSIFTNLKAAAQVGR